MAVDSGNFMGYPSMFLDVPDEFGFCFTQAFQSIGLGLATAIGAALARPDRLPVAALGDGGALMGASELETVVRLGLPMVVVVYDDAAYGAEVHHFGPQGLPLDTVRFPETDFASIARGYGFEALTVRAVDDLAPVVDWLDGPRDAPLLWTPRSWPTSPRGGSRRRSAGTDRGCPSGRATSGLPPPLTTADEVAAMTAACMPSMTPRTAFAAQSPSAMRVAFAFISRFESPTEPGSTAFCTALNASSSAMSAPVRSSVVLPSRSAVPSAVRIDASWAASADGQR